MGLGGQIYSLDIRLSRLKMLESGTSRAGYEVRRSDI